MRAESCYHSSWNLKSVCQVRETDTQQWPWFQYHLQEMSEARKSIETESSLATDGWGEKWPIQYGGLMGRGSLEDNGMF